MNVHVNRRAQRDLDEIWDYIARDSVDAANRVLDEIYRALRRLEDFPGIGHTRADVGDATLRF